MPAIIQSLVNGLNPVVGQSRNDVVPGDVITLNSVGAATTWAWSLPFAPQDVDRTSSAATLAGVLTGPGPITFTVDNEGAYLVSLVTDLGLPSESRQFVRIRVLTTFGSLSLVAADERRDDTKNPPAIPVDADATGWANDQNYNLNKILSLVEHTAASGRVIFVDANRGKLNSNTPNTTTQGYADFSTVSQAITAALTNPDYNGGVPPTIDSPIIVAVRPGLYDEDLSVVPFSPFVHVIAWPSEGEAFGEPSKGDRSVTIRNTTAGILTHVLNLPLATDYVIVKGINFVCTKSTTNAVLRKIGDGTALLLNCRVSQENNSVTQGACVAVDQGGFIANDSVFIQENLNPDRLVLESSPAAISSASVQFRRSSLIGPSVALLNQLLSPDVNVSFASCLLRQRGVNPLSFGVAGTASSLVLAYSELALENGTTNAIQVNPTAAGNPGDVFLGLYWTRLGFPSVAGIRHGVSFDTTGIVGAKICETSASEYTSVTSIGVLTSRATCAPKSIFFDNGPSGLVAENVQDAIDETVGLSRSLSFSRTMTVPTAGVPPLTYSEFFLIPNTFASVSVYAWLATAFAGTIAADVTLDVLVRPNVTIPGAFASVIGGPNNVGTLTSNAINIVATDLGTKTGPSVVEFRVVYNVIPAAGDGFVVTFLIN